MNDWTTFWKLYTLKITSFLRPPSSSLFGSWKQRSSWAKKFFLTVLRASEPSEPKEEKHEAKSTNLTFSWFLFQWCNQIWEVAWQAKNENASYITIWIPLMPTTRRLGKIFIFCLAPSSKTKYRGTKAQTRASAKSSKLSNH